MLNWEKFVLSLCSMKFWLLINLSVLSFLLGLLFINQNYSMELELSKLFYLLKWD